ncbi:MAG: teichoic acid biosynthesis protein [Clostridiales bacterium]|nr:teichoic acid biosynthesis protein [Clostridiales bacterium]
MLTEVKSFVINKIYWERIFFNLVIEPFAECDGEYFLRNSEGKEIPLSGKKEGEFFHISINMACVENRSFLENGRWFIVAKLRKTAGELEEYVCHITSNEAYKLDDYSRIFRYAEEQMAYTVSFGVLSEDEKALIFYIDSNFMIENKKWKRRRYVKEVRSFQDKFKRFFMLASILLIRAYYYALYFAIPKRGNHILIMSETKDALWGNLKYIDDRLKGRGLDQVFKIEYSYRSTAGRHQSFKDIFSWMKVVTKIAAQDYIFIDDYAPVFGFFNLGKKTRLIQVWHAGEGFKSVGYSRFGKDGSPFPQGSCHKQYTHVITGSEHLIDVFREVFAIESEAFYPVGMPRLDGFLDQVYISDFKDGFYKEYPYLREKKIILFAPTYRGAEQKLAYYDYDKIDLKRIYDFCKKENYAFLIKMHPFVKELIMIPEEYRDSIYEFSQYSNINDLYYVTDILITDYSSNYFEYALLERPVLFYTYDREIYELTRGVHRSIKDNAPGKVCDTFIQLMESLENGDFEEEKIKQFVIDNFGGYKGNASDRVIDDILLKGELVNE